MKVILAIPEDLQIYFVSIDLIIVDRPHLGSTGFEMISTKTKPAGAGFILKLILNNCQFHLVLRNNSFLRSDGTS